ncbi:MAG: FecCD family ABC transporter permease [Nocardioidaceae bacterium]
MTATLLRRSPGHARARAWRSPAGRFSLRYDARSGVVCGLLLAAVLVISAVTLSTGEYDVPLPDMFRALLGDESSGAYFIVHTLRLPRLLTALLVGVALGVGGGMFQSLSRNPLGSPDIIGFNTGAATGALTVILVLHGSMLGTSVGALVGGIGTALVVYVLAIKKGVQGFRLILIGIGIAAMLASVNSYLLTRAELTDAQEALMWLTGSLNGRTWGQAQGITIAVLVLMPLAIPLGRRLRTLELGDDMARGLGIGAETTRLASVVVAVALTAVSTAVAGPIGFIALSAPQIARRLTRVPGPNIMASALTGALLLAVSDLAAQRMFDSVQLPVGVATGAVGGIYLAWLLSQDWRKGHR